VTGRAVRAVLRAAVLAALLVVALLALPGRAEGHAVLLATQPGDGAAHATGSPPPAVELRFGEPVAILRLVLVGPAGRTDLRPVATVDGGTVRAPLPPGLGPGAYGIDWRVRSADAHPMAGVVAFTVGAATTAAAPGPAPAADIAGQLAGLVRAAALLLLLGSAGGVVFDRLVAPIPAPGGGRAAAVAGGLLALGALGLKGASLLGEPPSAILGADVWTVAAASTAGRSAVALLLAAALLAASRRGLRLLGAGAAVLALPLTGHAATDPPTVVALLLHGTAAAVWIGGLGPLAAILARDPPWRAAAAVRRFSGIALPAVLLLVGAGFVLAMRQIGSVDAIGRDPYATVLAAKAALVLGLLGIALDNRLRRTPALDRDRPGAARGLRRAIGAEAILMAGVLALTGVLATLPPPRVAGGHALHGAPPPSGRSVAVPFDGGLLLLEATPAVAGANAVTVRVLDRGGAPRALPGVRLALAPADGSTGEATRDLAPAEGAWTGRVVLPAAGRWIVRIEVLVDDFTRLSTGTVLDLR
jgi:copper transport protein